MAILILLGPIKFKYTRLPVDFLGRMQCWWLFGFGKDYNVPKERFVKLFFFIRITLVLLQ
jgi:hypothetical protein